MKVKINNLDNVIVTALRDYNKQAIEHKNFKMKDSINIIKTIHIIEQELENIRKATNDFVEKYAKRDEKGNMVQAGIGIAIKDEYIELVRKREKELAEMEIEIPIEPIKIDELVSKEENGFKFENSLSLESLVKAQIVKE